MNKFQYIPSVDELLQTPFISELLTKLPGDYVIANVRQAVQECREQIKMGAGPGSREEARENILTHIQALIAEHSRGSLSALINATGVVLHTNLGRAPLAGVALEAIQEMASGYCNLEYNLEAGKRGSRYQHVESLLCRITGAEAALVVNNNAAAVLLALNTLAQHREVIVSRGQLVEIGGAFRIPDVMKASGARLIEVGTTNRTYINDFAAAINDSTAMLFSAHTSNYKIIGFTHEASLEELAALGAKHRIPVMQDLGSGVLMDLSKWGLRDEPTVQSCILAGVDIVSFSGDKLLGGPQAGILAGKKDLITALKTNQLTRALRVDKLTIAALEATLMIYEQGNPTQDIPIIRMLCTKPEELKERALLLCSLIERVLPPGQEQITLEAVPVKDMVGGGSYPEKELDGWGVKLASKSGGLDEINRRLRRGRPGVVCRTQEDSLLFSLRTIKDDEMKELCTRIFESTGLGHNTP